MVSDRNGSAVTGHRAKKVAQSQTDFSGLRLLYLFRQCERKMKLILGKMPLSKMGDMLYNYRGYIPSNSIKNKEEKQ